MNEMTSILLSTETVASHWKTDVFYGIFTAYHERIH